VAVGGSFCVIDYCAGVPCSKLDTALGEKKGSSLDIELWQKEEKVNLRARSGFDPLMSFTVRV
jgi:hypothetical protein